MYKKPNANLGRRVALAIAGLWALAGCRDQDTAISGLSTAAGDPAVAVVASSGGAVPGEQVTVAVHAEGPQGVKLHGLQGILRFDADRLAYVGQSVDEEHPVMVMVNDKAAATGAVRFIAVNPGGLDANAAVFRFQVKGAGYTHGLAFEFEGAAAADHVTWANAKLAPGVQVSDIVTASIIRGMGRAEWVARLRPAERLDAQLTPGQYRLNLRYGDADRDGFVDVADVAYLSDLSIGLDLLIDATNRDAVIAGNVEPLNDGAGGVVRPGLQPGSTNPYGVIDVGDVSCISDASVGFNCAPVRPATIIPGREPLATNVVVVNTDITTNTHWTKGNIYQVGDAIKGSIYVTGATLTIDPGTRIEGWHGTGVFGSGGVGEGQGTLIIKRDGMIIADGTALEPIVMTCKLPPFVGPRSEPANTRWPGCWGGLIVAGNATINADDANATVGSGVPGRTPAGATSTQDESDASVIFGGNNDDDNSGILRYVRSEYGGARFTTTKERNGITFDGVGRGTTVDYIQVYASLDDGTEFFGGTVNIKHVYNIANEDDNIDWVLGWRGSGQFIIVQADSMDGDRCMEADNNGIDAGDPDRAPPRSNPTIYNITCVGKVAPIRYANASGLPASCHTQLNALSAAGSNCVNQAFLFRQNTAGTIRNAIGYRYSAGLDFDQPNGAIGGGVTPSTQGLCVQIAAAPANPGIGTGLSFRYALISQGPVAGGSLPAGATSSVAGDPDPTDPGVAGGVPADCASYTVVGGYTGSNLEAMYLADANNHITVFGNGDVAGDYLRNPLSLIAPDFRPKANSAPVTATAAPNPGTVNGFVFEAANYIGAVPGSNSNGSNIPWYSGWTRGWETATTK